MPDNDTGAFSAFIEKLKRLGPLDEADVAEIANLPSSGKLMALPSRIFPKPCRSFCFPEKFQKK